MFKASIFLVAAALIALAYGWVSGIDAVLYASIGFSAVAGLALLASTIADRKKYPREGPRKESRQVPREPGSGAFQEPPPPPPPPRRPLRPEPSYPEPRYPEAEPTFKWSEDEEFAGRLGAQPDQPVGSAGSGDFRSRLVQALSAPDDGPLAGRTDPGPTPEAGEPSLALGRTKKRPSRPRREPEVETEEVEQDWIRVDDLPGMSDAPAPPGGLSPARKPRRPRSRSGEPAAAPADTEPAGSKAAVAAEGAQSPRPRIRPRRGP
ncbi:MAG: hypothetical protein WD602_04650 [Actinomycetota bacterium]